MAREIVFRRMGSSAHGAATGDPAGNMIVSSRERRASMTKTPSKTGLADIDELWDFADPAESERTFRAALTAADTAGDDDYRLQLFTQIARTHSLRRQFDQAHELLDSVEKELTDATQMARVRYLLERGRTFNSAGDKATARGHFIEAWERARTIDEHGL